MLVVSAYKQLRPAQKSYVDAYVANAEREAERHHERISLALYRAIPPEVIDASQGMLDIPLVRAAIAERINERAAQEDFTWQRWLKEVAAVAFSTADDYLNVDPITGVAEVTLKSVTPEAMSAVQSIKTEGTGDPLARGYKQKVEIKLHDKLRALGMMQEFYTKVMENNPHMNLGPLRDSVAVGSDVPRLPASVTVENAAEEYGKMIDG